MKVPYGRGARVDETGLAFAGSMLQAQLYVNDRTDELNRAVLAELPELAQLNPEIRGSPLFAPAASKSSGTHAHWANSATTNSPKD